MKKNGTEKKAAAEKPKKDGGAEKDKYGFRVGTKRSEAIAELAAGKTLKEVRKTYSMLSFTKTLRALGEHGFKVNEGSDGKCSVTGKLKA